MKNSVVASGVVTTIIGVVILLLSIMTVPYTTSRLAEVPHSTVLLNESIVVPEYHFYYYYYYLVNFSSEDTLHINFNVTEGGSIDFWVMDETDFIKFDAGESYEYYVVPSRQSISKADILWHPPSNGTIYFVWDNIFSTTSKSVTAYFTVEWTEWENVEFTENRTLLPSEASYLGILLFICGISLIGYGFVSKPTVQHALKKELHPEHEIKKLEKFKQPLKEEYEKLVDIYTRIYGADGKNKLDTKLEEYINQGLTGEEAIQKIDMLLKKYRFK